MKGNALLRKSQKHFSVKQTEKKLKRDKTIEGELLEEHTHPLDLILRTVSDHSNVILNRKYALNCLGYSRYKRIYRWQGS